MNSDSSQNNNTVTNQTIYAPQGVEISGSASAVPVTTSSQFPYIRQEVEYAITRLPGIAYAKNAFVSAMIEWTQANRIRLFTVQPGGVENVVFDIAPTDIKVVRQSGTALYFVLATDNRQYVVEFSISTAESVMGTALAISGANAIGPFASSAILPSGIYLANDMINAEHAQHIDWWIESLKRNGVRIGFGLSGRSVKTVFIVCITILGLTGLLMILVMLIAAAGNG